ncbi:MAG: UDP-3-O-[3-hydroxymyristoyl] N-acetylglucosamine deacetylase [Desulfobulbus propionicus]|nr:MAG: UDP-3-O-[3-hydroxymyristoyl] N-acetylglucosamine deacetylase [Desulfobulbus propionicus]
MGSSGEAYQHTLKHSVSCYGVGLHTGRTVNLTIRPAPINTGIRFFRSDAVDRTVISARVENVVDTRLATTIGHNGHQISTTEHLMAAFCGVGIDNAEIDIDSHEVPIMDGSAKPFICLLKKGGRQKQDAPRKMLRVTRPISYAEEGKSIRVEPCDGFRITGRIHFDNELIDEQTYTMDFDSEKFCREIASARTFGFVEQVEYLWENGLALGGTLDNTIAIHWDRKSILNEDGLRFHDEFVRHKVLDLVGDLMLLGTPLLGHVIADRSGHGLHFGLMQTIAANPQCWEYVEYKKKQGKTILQKAVKTTKAAGHCLTPFFTPGGSAVIQRQACAV